MNITLKEPVLGMVDKKSNIELRLSDVYIGNERNLVIFASINLIPLDDIESKHIYESFTLLVTMDDKIVIRENIEANLVDGCNKIFTSKEIPINNFQPEVHKFEMVLTDIKNNRIEYTKIKDMIPFTFMNSKIYIRFDYYKRGNNHNFSYYTNSNKDVYMKMNNNNWKKITEGFIIENKDLESKINYLQLYTTDDENNKIYSNVLRIVKSEA